MALDINGYNASFNAFVKFAQNSFVTNDKTAALRGRWRAARRAARAQPRECHLQTVGTLFKWCNLFTSRV